MNKLDAVMAALQLLKETKITPGPYAAKDWLDLSLEAIQNTQSKRFEKLRALVGESRTKI
ncbi:hypothetical protein GN958_ATG01714 [Phytophthora infestans]|uniref:Uncharacterized protein n=1 Tax=Phytophthora infestans TaxID=4787 RepID=A0A8S9V6F2_PHYIN|nr:hypothetical protein GN958_ATG01714 [Phytophthora infestans]